MPPGTGETIQWLRALSAPKFPGLVPSTRVCYFSILVPGALTPSGLCKHLMHVMHRNTCRQNTHALQVKEFPSVKSRLQIQSESICLPPEWSCHRCTSGRILPAGLTAGEEHGWLFSPSLEENLLFSNLDRVKSLLLSTAKTASSLRSKLKFKPSKHYLL